jgi:integrase/recombinase XerD
MYHKGEDNMYKEEMSIKLLGRISLEYPDIDQNKLRNIIDEVVSNYRVEQEEKALVVQDDMQEKIWLYLSAKLTEGLSEKTLKEYKRELLRFSNYMRKDVDKISAMDIRLYLATITKERNLKNTSLGEVLFKLKSFFNWLASDGYISKSPTINIKQPKCEKKLRNALTEEQLEKLRDACETLKQRALVELFFASGIRLEELSQLNNNDIDWANMSIRIRKGKGKKERVTFY